ncbi:MAG TPA: FAD-binding oxidoreductase [Candidatus Limnocylindria bacterium]|nr:FAD-binding oxidoreductase [Candidatus Limnocylindria bacterium]
MSASPKEISVSIAIEEKLREIVGAAHVRAANIAEAFCGVRPRSFVEPGNERELAAVLRLANEEGLVVIPRGSGTKLGWGNLPARADLLLSTARLDKIIEHVWADLTVTVEAGCTWHELQESLSRHGQRLALDPLWPGRATVGGILSTNDSGALRLRFGSLRDLIIGVTIALPDGTLASSGGKVVKNVAGYDLPKLITGAFGTLGVITRAIFRLHPLPKIARTVSASMGNLDAAQRVLDAVQDSKLAHAAMQLRAAGDAAAKVDVLFEGTETGLAAQETHLKKLLEPMVVTEAPASVWNARQELWFGSDSAVIAKFSLLPVGIANGMETVRRVASINQVRWKAIAQATGIGWLRLDGSPDHLRAVLRELRTELELGGGSLVILHRPAEMAAFESWGNAGDALPLMRAVKQQFDMKSTLNPGRFVGGI